MTLIALTLSGGVAMADRWRGRDDSSYRSGGTRVDSTRWSRGDRWDRRDNRRYDNRRYDNRRFNDRRVVVQRARPTFRNNRFYFTGGYYRPYTRPVINVRYRDYYQRPQILVENYAPVPGYVWVRGHWHWDGYEWQWTPGRYEVDQSYSGGYYDGTYDNGSYYGVDDGYGYDGRVGVGIQGQINF